MMKDVCSIGSYGFRHSYLNKAVRQNRGNSDAPLMWVDNEGDQAARKPRRTPAATAEPITPATFGPMACMSR